ncbi:Mss4-like protein [Mycena amicta]|nr:Mss4-like protein [Mycena amicta]
MTTPSSPSKARSLPIPWPEGAQTHVYTGGCHCKKIRFEFEHPEIYSMPVTECNCTICESRGCLNAFTWEDKFKLTSGSNDDMTTYKFGSKKAEHRFCSTCGTAIGALVRSVGCVVINTRTVDGIDLKRLQRVEVNGRAVDEV